MSSQRAAVGEGLNGGLGCESKKLQSWEMHHPDVTPGRLGPNMAFPGIGWMPPLGLQPNSPPKVEEILRWLSPNMQNHAVD